MGTVWLAHDELLKRAVAVKEVDIPPGFSAEERADLEARMLREARAAARLTHPGAVGVYDVVEHHDRPWIVMEYVDAPTLEELVESSGPMDVGRAAKVGLDLLEVLEVAHSEGIVHRDVKPGNVMCPTEGAVKLADFGIASIADDPKITQTGLVLGSPSFMAPEQAQHGSGGPPVDLWSLGATLYFAVEGEAPFDKGAAVPTLTAVLGEEPRAMTRAGALEPVIERLLEKDPDKRLTAPEAKSMLASIATGASTKAVTTVADPLTPTTPVTSVEREVEPARPVIAPRPEPREAARWLPWIALALGLAALIALPLLLDDDDGRGDAGGASRQQDRAQDDADEGNADGGAGGDTDDEAAPPAEDWTSYTDESTGYTLHHPETWSIVPRSAESIDFTDPATGTYLRVAWTDEPGPDVMERLEDIAASFASEHEDYVEVQMTPTEYQGHEAGLWEYTYTEEGAALHAYNLQFVIDDTYGFALNFQTHEEEWDGSQDLWNQLQESFEPPS